MLTPRKWWQRGKKLYKCDVTTTRVTITYLTYVTHNPRTKKITLITDDGKYNYISFKSLAGYFNTPHDAVHASLAHYSNIHPEDDHEVIELFNQYTKVLEKWLHTN